MKDKRMAVEFIRDIKGMIESMGKGRLLLSLSDAVINEMSDDLRNALEL